MNCRTCRRHARVAAAIICGATGFGGTGRPRPGRFDWTAQKRRRFRLLPRLHPHRQREQRLQLVDNDA